MSKNQQGALRATIDRMVEDSIRKILPEVMNEVLLRTLTQGNIVQERRQQPAPQRRQPPQGLGGRSKEQVQRQQQLAGIDRSMSLREALGADDAGADYYEQAERALESRRPQQRQQQPRPVVRPQPVVEQYDENEMYGEDEIFDFDSPTPPSQPQSRQSIREEVVAQRISELPPALQGLAEDTFRLVSDDEYEDDGGEWGANEFAPSGNSGQARAPNLNIDRAAASIGLDFSRLAKTVAVTEGVNKPKITQQDVNNEAQWKMQQLERKRALLDSKKVG